ncbi:MAG TPA: bifunctional DNA primase/polymerase [Candidatus Eremiobacteraceae bacterium]|nr:bifunctional DNA primase/polymerase [Candidatus Eremiobacteraceae bacterium]
MSCSNPASSEASSSSSTQTIQPNSVTALRVSAEDALRRGFAIMTCEPRAKKPWGKYSPHGCDSATSHPEVALRPYTDNEEANYGIGCEKTNLTVVDCDHGLADESALLDWMLKHDIPQTLIVRSGRDGEAGFHLYYSGAEPTGSFELDGVTGELKGVGSLVVGPGSIHPSGKPYTIFLDKPIVPLPERIKSARKRKIEAVQPDTVIPEGSRWVHLQRTAGQLRNVGLSEDGIYAALKDFAVHHCEKGETYPDEKVRELAVWAASDKCDGGPTGIVTVGKLTTTPKGYSMTAEEWMAHDFSAEESESLVGTETNAIIRPLTKNLLIAPDKSFKTTFLMRLVAGLAAGKTVFEQLPVRRACRVVYFHAELNPAEVQQRITASVVNIDTEGRFVNVRDIRTHLIDEEGQQFILETMQHYKPDVVILDPWQELIRGYDENAQKDTSLARAFITLLIETFKCTAFLIQHMGNDESKGGRGHSGMKGWRDTLIKLHRPNSGDIVRVTVEPRWGEKVTFDLAFKDGTLTPVFGQPKVKSVQRKNLVAFFKQEYPEGATTKQVAEGEPYQGMTLDAVKKMLQRAVDDGDLVKTETPPVIWSVPTEEESC